MSETITFKPTAIGEVIDISIVNGALTGTTLVLTKGDSSTIQVPLAPLIAGKVTQADIDNAIASLVDSSPGTLNTLNELAAALGDDPNFATTIATAISDEATARAAADTAFTSALADKVAKAGDTMTGFLTLSADPTSAMHAATRQYVLARIADLVASAPGVLDTLNELATALGNDPNFATTITTALAGKLSTTGHDANSVPVSISGTLADLDFPASSFFVRLASGNIKAGTIAEVKTLLALAESDITGLVADLALKAPLASPTFTGTPAAPTASLNTNTTQVATTAFVLAQISALVASSPAALDTLNELAAALGNDANFATTVTNALALKAPLASPTFTGTPAAPTASGGTNSTQVATTAYVQGEISSKATIIENVNQHGNTGSAYTLPDVTSYTVHNVTLNAPTVTFTMPTAGAGKSFVVKAKQDATGGRLAVFTGVIWPGGTAPTLTTTANHADTLVFSCIDGSVWEGALVAADYAS